MVRGASGAIPGATAVAVGTVDDPYLFGRVVNSGGGGGTAYTAVFTLDDQRLRQLASIARKQLFASVRASVSGRPFVAVAAPFALDDVAPTVISVAVAANDTTVGAADGVADTAAAAQPIFVSGGAMPLRVEIRALDDSDPAMALSRASLTVWKRIAVGAPGAMGILQDTVDLATALRRSRRATVGGAPSGSNGSWTQVNGSSSWAASTSARIVVYALAAGASYRFAVRGADAAGNVGAPATWEWGGACLPVPQYGVISDIVSSVVSGSERAFTWTSNVTPAAGWA
jgi:hypothetical protein